MGYPWATGDALLAADLNAAIANSTSNVRSFGATGNGTTNDTAAIQAAANAIPASGGVLMFPPGIYAVATAILVPSNTLVQGQGATLLAMPTGFPASSSLLSNVNNAVTTITDHDIAVQNMTFDYGTSGAAGAAHAVVMGFVRNARVSNCQFQCRGAGDAVAMVGCYNTLVADCTAYGFTNCAYDHWWGPAYGRVIGCYAETVASTQIVMWNPENTAEASNGLVAKGFVLANCTLVGTGASAIPIQIEPLASANTASDVVVQGNTFNNVVLVLRGATSRVVVADNVFDAPLGGASAIASYPQLGGVPADLSITGNMIFNPATVGANLAVIRVACDTAVISGNAVLGATTNSLDTASNAPVVMGNYWSTAVNSSASFGQSGNMRLPAGLDATPIGSATPATGSFTSLAASDTVQLGYHNLDTIVGGQANNLTTATAGFLLVSFTNGAPTGVPTNRAKGIALVYDTVNHKLWAYDNPASAWRGIVLT